MNIICKLLRDSDLAAFKELLFVFGEAFEESQTYQSAVPNDDYLRSLLVNDSFIAVVGLVNGRVVGGLAAYVLQKFEQERKEIYIYDLAVLEEYRRQGIATELIETLKVTAKTIGAYAIFVQADTVDEPAIKLYESLGIREDVYHFDILPL